MSEFNERAVTDLYSNVSFGGGGRSSSGGSGGSTMTSSPRPRPRPAHITPASSNNGGVRNAVATGVCWIAGGAAGTVGVLGATAVTKNPVASWGAGVAIGGAVGDICTDVLKR